MGSFHLQGYVLPSGEPQDLWLVDGVIRSEPLPRFARSGGRATAPLGELRV